MKMEKVNINNGGCEGCFFRASEKDCLLYLLEDLEDIFIDIPCSDAESEYIFKLVEKEQK